MTPDAPRAPLSESQRAAALSQGAPRVPRRVVVWGVVVACALALGGTALERLASSAGLNPVAAPTGLDASLASYLGVVHLGGTRAPGFSLTDERGRPAALSGMRGHVVVLSFFDARCADACAVLARELVLADRLLGARRAQVDLVTVNTSPHHRSISPRSRASAATGLGRLGNWRLVSGPLGALNAVWRDYGVSIRVYRGSGTVVHNNVMYFIDPAGRLRLRTTPVADETAGGTFSLPADQERRAAGGIAAYAASLLRSDR